MPKQNAYRNKYIILACTYAAIFAVIVLIESTGRAQDSTDHELHHSQTENTSPDTGVSSSPDIETQNPMGGMMEGMHGPPPKDIYPRLFTLDPSDPEDVARLKSDASRRVVQSVHEMSGAMAALKGAFADGDVEVLNVIEN